MAFTFLSLDQEKDLGEEVRKHPLLYDKRYKSYSDKNAINQAWETVAQGLYFVEDGPKVQRMFITLKQKYQRKKRELEDALRSYDEPTIAKAERSLEEYYFLSWLEDFTAIRKRRKRHADDEGSLDMERPTFEVIENSRGAEKASFVENNSFDLLESSVDVKNETDGEEEENFPKHNLQQQSPHIKQPQQKHSLQQQSQQHSSQQSQQHSSQQSQQHSLQQYQQHSSQQSQHSLQQQSQNNNFEQLQQQSYPQQQQITNYPTQHKIKTQEQPIQSVEKLRLNPSSKVTEKHSEESDEDLFCKALAQDLKKLPYRQQCMAKHEMRNVIFKHQMEALRTKEESMCQGTSPLQSPAPQGP